MKGTTAAFLLMVASWGGASADTAGYTVADFGAKGDGRALDTVAVQQAVDACAAAAGGTVYFGPGTYLCGSIRLKSHVTLYLDRGAVIKGSPNKDDYDPYEKLDFKNDADIETAFFHFALIWGEDVEHVGIVGNGTIDSNRARRGGPKTIALKRCRYVAIQDVRLVNTPNYVISLLGTDYVDIDGVTIQNAYCDGIDPDSCRNIRIANCHIESYDDAIVPKASFSLGERRSCENVTVSNCILSTNCNALKLGTESGGDFKRIAFANCVLMGRHGEPATGGIALESVDGSNIDGITASNITMVDVRAPIFIRLGNRGRDMEQKAPGSIRNVAITNIVATNASLACSITGIPGHSVEGVTLSNIRVSYQGANPRLPEGTAVPEVDDKYPEPDMFGMLPAYGWYGRHVRDLSFSQIRLDYGPDFWRLTQTKDSEVNWNTESGVPQPSRPDLPGTAACFEDISNMVIEDFGAEVSTDGAPLIQFVNVEKSLLHGCLASDAPVFLAVAGTRSRAITVADCALSGADAIILAKDVPPGAVRK